MRSENEQCRNPPLADYCALCGDGYSPALEITIGDEPTESLGEEQYGWSHVQCVRDHDRLFIEAFEESDGFAEHFEATD